MYENRDTKPVFGFNASILKHYRSGNHRGSRGILLVDPLHEIPVRLGNGLDDFRDFALGVSKRDHQCIDRPSQGNHDPLPRDAASPLIRVKETITRGVLSERGIELAMPEFVEPIEHRDPTL